MMIFGYSLDGLEKLGLMACFLAAALIVITSWLGLLYAAEIRLANRPLPSTGYLNTTSITQATAVHIPHPEDFSIEVTPTGAIDLTLLR